MSKCPKCNLEYDEARGGCAHCEEPLSEGGVIEHYIEQDASLKFRDGRNSSSAFSTLLKIVLPFLIIALLFFVYNIFKNSNTRPVRHNLPATAPIPPLTVEVAVARPDPPRPSVVPPRPAIVPPPKPKTFDAVLSFSDGLAAFSLDKKFGFMNKTGKVVILNKYEDAWWFTEGLAVVKLGGKWGVIDKSGKTVVDFKFDELRPYSCNLAPCLSGGKWGYIDHHGEEVIRAQFDNVWWFVEDRAYVSTDTGFLIDVSGKTAFKLELPGDINAMKKQLAEIKVRGCWKTDETSGKQVFRPGYCFSEGLACITRQKKNGERLNEKRIVFDDYSGKPAIEDRIASVEEAASFSNGLAMIKLGGKTGFIDR
ncbi:MAG TPA: WG repeat-containing protein, partial [Candidatus Wallbacteria bacterium]|nr:WG repeat-containing protein [Candidatus Wallbacteria bacterium]